MGTTGTLDVALPAKTLNAAGQAEGDLYYDKVVSLLHFNGANGSTTFTDQIPGRIWTPVGNAKISTAQFLYGGASGLFDGTGDVITCPDHDDFDLGSGDFTAEIRIRTGATLSAARRIFCKTNNAGDFAGILLYLSSASLQFYASSNGTSWDLASGKVIQTTLLANTWYEVAISRNGRYWNAWVGGAAGAGSTFPLVTSPGTSLFRGSRAFAIGASSDALAGYLGNNEEFRLTKGVGRYPGPYTPVPRAFPDELAPVGRLNVTLPKKILNQQPVTSVANIILPKKTLTAYGAVGVVGRGASILPRKTLVGVGVTGVVGRLDASLPAKTLLARAHAHVELILPAKTLVARGVNGVTGRLDGTLPAKRLTARGITGKLSAADIILPAKRLTAYGVVGTIGTLNRSLPKLRLIAIGHVGGVGRADIILPAKVLLASGYGTVTGIAHIVLPKRQLSAFGTSTIAEVYNTWVLNTRKNALTSYGPEFAFNSYAIFNGQVLAAGPQGLVLLGLQDDDAGVDITARIRTKVDDFESSLHKRVRRAYAGYETKGDLIFRVITPENGTNSYTLVWNGDAGLQQRRVPIGRGIKSRYFQFEVENVAGCEFRFDNLLIYPTKTGRRVYV